MSSGVRKDVGRLTISPPAPCKTWLVQTAGSPGSPLCQSASYRRTEEKRAGWRDCPLWLPSPHMDKEHVMEPEVAGEQRSPACRRRRHMRHVDRRRSGLSWQSGLPECTGPHRGMKRMLRWVGSRAQVSSLGKVSHPWTCAPSRHERILNK